METNLKFDGLVVKANFDSELKCKTNFSDCALCSLDCTSCKDCPLSNGFYFKKREESPQVSSFKIRFKAGEANDEPLCMSSVDKKKVSSVIKDLKWLSEYLESSLRLGVVLKSTISPAKSCLDLSLQLLDSIKSFDVI